MATNDSTLTREAVFYMVLLALQFGLQPILSRHFTPSGISRSSVVLVQEFLKFFMALLMLFLSGSMQSATTGTKFETFIARKVFGGLLFILVLNRLECPNMVKCRIRPSSSIRCSKYCSTSGLSKFGLSDLQRVESNEDPVGCAFLLPCYWTPSKLRAGVESLVVTVFGFGYGAHRFPRQPF